MRTRTRQIALNTVPGSSTGQYWFNGVFQNASNTMPSIVSLNEFETITDDPKGRGWKKVNHIHEKHFATSSERASWGGGGNVAELIGPNAYWAVWGYLPKFYNIGEFQITYPRTIAQQLSAAHHKFNFTNQVDTLLNVVEAPQLKSSIVSATERFKRNDGWIDQYRQALRKIRNGYLFWSFGIAPLIADIGKIAGAVRSLRKELQRQANGTGEEVVVHDTVNGVVDLNTTGYISGTQMRRVMGKRDATRTVSLRGINKPKYGGSTFRTIDRMLANLGATGPASYVWERIPFSFVVDWFVDLKAVTDKLDNVLTGGTKQVSAALVSQKVSLSASCVHYTNGVGNGSYTYENQAVCGSYIDWYTREFLGQDPSIVSWSGRFGKRQLGLSAALLHQFVSKGRA